MVWPIESESKNTTLTYETLHAQVTTLMETLGAAQRHAKDARDYPDDLLRLKGRLINAITECSNVTHDDLAELIGD